MLKVVGCDGARGRCLHPSLLSGPSSPHVRQPPSHPKTENVDLDVGIWAPHPSFDKQNRLGLSEECRQRMKGGFSRRDVLEVGWEALVLPREEEEERGCLPHKEEGLKWKRGTEET